MDIEYTKYARDQLKERDIKETEVREAVRTPDKIIEEADRIIYQKLFERRERQFLARVIAVRKGSNVKVLTVYRTTKFSKYQ